MYMEKIIPELYIQEHFQLCITVCPFAWQILGNKDFSLSYIVDNNEEITALHCAVQTTSLYYWHHDGGGVWRLKDEALV